MKYDENLYIGTGIYDGDRDVDIRCYSEKMVTCKKSHICATCGKEIQAGERAVREKGFLEDEPVSCYTCLSCMNKWMEESGVVEVNDEN